MENQKKQQLSSLNPYLNTQKGINLDRDIRKHIEKTEIIVKKEEVRQATKKLS
jgi:hypothetical protein